MRGRTRIFVATASVVASVRGVSAFAPQHTASAAHDATNARSGQTSSTALFRGSKNAKKQMDLAKKMALAKQQKKAADLGSADASDGVASSSDRKGGGLTDEEIKTENDKRRFEELLNSETATAMFEFNTQSGYLTRQQEEEAANAGFRGIDRLFENDPAPTEVFEGLVNIHNDNAIGENGAKNVVPWLHKNAARQKDYLLVITDPREKSLELRQTVASLSKSLPKAILDRVIIVNADSPPENRRWLKKNRIEDATIYSDEKREWMRGYTALGEKRWSMCMFILRDGKIERLVRDLDADLAPTVVKNAVKSL
mmetsp:Transcript_3837/g.8275  ORF Transcript_3837/g.8275 Transcript_3837/m.8275 type:complete len:312 (+) Transcript_3837:102-1037(+)